MLTVLHKYGYSKLYLRRHIKIIQRWKISFEAGWRVFRGPHSNWEVKMFM